MYKLLICLAISVHFFGLSFAHAQGVGEGPEYGGQGEGLRLYLAAGEGVSPAATIDGSDPWAIGAILNTPDDLFFGFDISGEGTVLDSTGGKTNDPGQAIAFNGLIGTAIAPPVAGKHPLIEGAFLLGFRQKTVSCPESLVGFRCYADRDPDRDFDLNVGGLLMINVNNLSIGVRGTRESTQVMLGLNF